MKRLESVISICLLAILSLVGVGVFIKQFNYNISQLSSFVPSGFEMLSKVEVYNSENLYEKIDGKAPL